MFKVKDLVKPAAACRRIYPKTTIGGGAMFKKQFVLAITTLIMVVVSCFSPLAVTSTKAQTDEWACLGGDSPCGFPIEGGRDKFVVREDGEPGHDSCDPEGSCPWVWGHDYAWADEATAEERPTKVISVLNGKVTQACAIDTFQNKVIKVENSTWSAYYLHVDSCFVSVGQEVKVGDALGIMGNTGNFGMPGLYTHLHFALKRNNEEKALEDISPLWTSGSQPIVQAVKPVIIDETEAVKEICPKMKTDEIFANYSSGTVIHHSAGGDWEESVRAHCKDPYPPYPFFINKDGTIHQLVDWKGHAWATGGKNYNVVYVAVSLEGNFEIEEPTDEQVESLVLLLRWFWSEGVPHKVTTHKKLGADAGYVTACPGKNLIEMLPEIVQMAEDGESFDGILSTDSGTNNLYRRLLELNPTIKLILKSGIVEEDILFKIITWSIRAVLAFLFLFLYLILRWIFNKEVQRKFRIHRGRHLTYLEEIPRGYLNGWFWLVLIWFRWRLAIHKDDYVYYSMGMEVWWIALGLAVFFWFAIRADSARIRAEREPSKVGKFVWDWGIGTVTFIVAAYIWGVTFGLALYTLSGNPFGSNPIQPNPIILDLPDEPLEWKTPLQDIPDRYKDIIREYGPEIVQIAREEGVPPEVIPTLVFKEGGQLLTNPANGEGFCGFYDMVASGQAYFPPGKVSPEDALKQFRLCAQQFKKRSAPYNLTFETTDLDVLGPIYMRYNGNIDCHGAPFPSYREHPYVMNGWDEAHTGMIARDGLGGCVALKVIGAIPAHVRIGNFLREIYTSPPTLPPDPVAPDPLAPLTICEDQLGFCGFALPGGSASYILGTAAIGGNDFHCNLIGECGWDYWKVNHLPSYEDPTDVLSMLNGYVSRIGVYENKTPYLEITNSSGRMQASYHCDKYYVAEGDTVKWGQPICLMGNQGASDWTHLHLVLKESDGSSVRDQSQYELK